MICGRFGRPTATARRSRFAMRRRDRLAVDEHATARRTSRAAACRPGSGRPARRGPATRTASRSARRSVIATGRAPAVCGAIATARAGVAHQRIFARNCFVRSCDGAREEVLRRPVLDDRPAVHHHDAIGRLAREAHLVGDADHRHAVARELLHHVEHVADRLGVERARRLVEQHQRRVHGERARDRDALLLAAGELAGIRVALVGEADACEQALGVGDGLVPRDAAHAHRRLDDVVEHRQVRPEVEALEDEADLDALPGDVALACPSRSSPLPSCR